MRTKKASIVVLSWNGRGYLGPCLSAVLAQDYPSFEVIVVDNGSTDGSADFVAEHFPQVRLIRNERNLGFATGNNVGLRTATGDLLVLLNQDTQVHPRWLAALASAFDDPATGIAGCKLLYPDGMIQHAGGYLYGPRGESDHVGRHAQDTDRFDQLTDAEFVTAAALAISRTVLEQIGPLDEGFALAYYEDVDWCYRARAAQFRVVYQPQAVVTHHESTTADRQSHQHKFALHQGRLRFLLKHHPLDRLLHEFGPAEVAWVMAMDRSEELMAARRAYLNALLALSSILAFRGSSPAEADALVGLLTDLRAAAVAGLASLDPPSVEGVPIAADHTQARLLQMLQETQTIRERPFTSQIPVLGGLIVAIRNLWNSVAAKWYVRPLIQQQSAFNAQVVRYLQGQSRDVAENVRELTALAERVATLEMPSSDHPHPREDSED